MPYFSVCPYCASSNFIERGGYAEELGPGCFAFKHWFECNNCTQAFEDPDLIEEQPSEHWREFVNSFA